MMEAPAATAFLATSGRKVSYTADIQQLSPLFQHISTPLERCIHALYTTAGIK